MHEYFFIGCDGALHDTRESEWSSNPLRQNYAWTHREIDSVADLKATLRAGQWAWPGGYPMYFITSDGAALSFESVRTELYNVAYAIRDSLNDGWRVVACDINYEDSELRCAHSGERIESAYGDD